MGDIVPLLGFPAPVARITAAAFRFVAALRAGDVSAMTRASEELDAAVEEQWRIEERHAAAIDDDAGAPVLTVLTGGLPS